MAWMSAKTALPILFTLLTFLSVQAQAATVQSENRCNLNDFLDHLDLLALPESQEISDVRLPELMGIGDCQYSGQFNSLSNQPDNTTVATDPHRKFRCSTELANLVSKVNRYIKTTIVGTAESLHAPLTELSSWLASSEKQFTSAPLPVNSNPFNDVASNEADPYWEYYDACDRWGVEFANLLATEQMTSDSHGIRRQFPIIQWLVWKQFASLNVSPHVYNDFSSSSSEWIELFEFHELETRDINFDAVHIQPVGPKTTLISELVRLSKSDDIFECPEEGRFIERLVAVVSERLDWVSNQVVPTIKRFELEARNNRPAQIILLRVEIADKMECLGRALLDWSDFVRPANLISAH